MADRPFRRLLDDGRSSPAGGPRRLSGLSVPSMVASVATSSASRRLSLVVDVVEVQLSLVGELT